MFFGSFAHTLDEKGRLMIPRKMREELGYKVYIMKGFDVIRPATRPSARRR